VDAHAFDPATRNLQALKDEGFDCAFIALHGRFGEDGTVQGALNCWGFRIPAAACWLQRWAWINGAPSWCGRLRNCQCRITRCLMKTATGRRRGPAGLAVVRKPANEGSSVGISKVKAPSELQAAYREAARHDKLVLAESFVGGGEYTVAILGEQALPVIKIEPANEFYDYEAKYLRDDTRYLCPSGLAAASEAEMQQLARQAFALIGGQGWGAWIF